MSYFHPVWLGNEKGSVNPFLELMLYKDRIQLATKDALYSDGEYYTPALTVTRHLSEFLPHAKRVLILGVGLGSMVQIIRKLRLDPVFTLVEIDEVVLQLALEFLLMDKDTKIDAVCDDAAHFMVNNKAKFDLIFIDIFESRVVPDFVTSAAFLNNCRSSLADGGRLAFNYIIDDPYQLQKVVDTFDSVFPNYKILTSDINRIFIA